MLRPEARRRWVAARWALRTVLGRYLEQAPGKVELRFAKRGKLVLGATGESLRFNLSHSGGLALIAVCDGREVGVDVERIRSRRPAEFYAAWTRREALAKCDGGGLLAPLPDAAIAVSAIDAGPGFAASVAVAGGELPAVQRFNAAPA